MSDTWQQPSQGDRLPFGEPYPGFAHTHQEYYEQHRRQQALLASTPVPQGLVPTIWQAMNPWWYPTFPPGFPPEKAAEIHATIRERRRPFHLVGVMFLFGVGAAIFRFFT